jgi:hypothetical protein
MQYRGKVALAATLGVLLTSCSDSYLPTGPSDASRARPSVGSLEVLEADALPCEGGESLLLIQEIVPWELDTDLALGANVAELIASGIGFCMAGSESVTAMDLSRFSTIVIAAAQNQAFYDNIFASGSVHPALTAFVDGGGVLVANLADVAGGPAGGGSWEGEAFVGGLRRVNAFHNQNTIVDGSHQVIVGPSECPSLNCGEIQDIQVRRDLDNWLFSSHGYFTDLPPGTSVLLTQPAPDPRNPPEPIMVEYPFGGGRVIASMVTAERRYSWTLSVRNLKLLANELAYAISVSTPVEDPPATASEQIAAMTTELEGLVEAGMLDFGTANSLRRKLMAAARSLEAGRMRTAANQIRAFMLEVEALMRSGGLDLEEGQRLLEGADALLATLSADTGTTEGE